LTFLKLPGLDERGQLFGFFIYRLPDSLAGGWNFHLTVGFFRCLHGRVK
jgi:hypothetical protein